MVEDQVIGKEFGAGLHIFREVIDVLLYLWAHLVLRGLHQLLLVGSDHVGSFGSPYPWIHMNSSFFSILAWGTP